MEWQLPGAGVVYLMGVKFWLGEVKSSRDEREQRTSCHRVVYKMVREVKGGWGNTC